jgi:hypothetical protein
MGFHPLHLVGGRRHCRRRRTGADVRGRDASRIPIHSIEFNDKGANW